MIYVYPLEEFPEDCQKIYDFVKSNSNIELSRNVIEKLWTEFSDDAFCAGFIMPNEDNMKEFIDWVKTYKSDEADKIIISREPIKVVINADYGGISTKANKLRYDPDFIKQVEEGKVEPGEILDRELKVVQLPAGITDYKIFEYDGLEYIVYVLNGKLYELY